MNEVFQAFGNNNNLQCTAKEVTMEATQVEGPDTCERGEIITVNTLQTYTSTPRNMIVPSTPTLEIRPWIQSSVSRVPWCEWSI